MQSRHELEITFSAIYWIAPFATAAEMAEIMRSSLKTERAMGLNGHYAYSQTKHAAMLRTYERFMTDNRLPRPSDAYKF